MFGRTLPAKVLASLALFASGVFIGSVAAIQHRNVAPWGLVAALLLIAIYGVALRLIRSGRTVMFFGLLGVQLGVLALATGLWRGYIIVSDFYGWTFSVGMVLISLVVLAWPDLQGAARYDGESLKSS